MSGTGIVFCILILGILYLTWKDQKLYKDMTKALGNLRKEYQEVQGQQSLLENRISQLVGGIREKNVEVERVQEHFTKIQDEMKLMKKRQQWLRNNFVKKIEIGLPENFYRNLKVIGKKLGEFQ